MSTIVMRDWQPQQTWVFVVGVLAWKHADQFTPFPQENRRDAALVHFFEEQRTSFITTGAFNPNMVLAPARRKTDARIGERVEVHTAGEWYKARLIDADAKSGTYKVHYYGWEATDDEWVKPSQIRTASVTQYTIGETVEVKWQGDWYPATIQGVQGNLHLIHYVDYAATWDEWVGSRRLRRTK